MQIWLVTVVELPVFQRQAESLWDDAEREAFIDFIARNPESGDLIPGTGGVRKVRWTRAGMGKRGGARVVYFYYNLDAPLFLLTAYAKAGQEDLSPEQKRIVREFAEQAKLKFSSKGSA
jgi:hypothetical protein